VCALVSYSPLVYLSVALGGALGALCRFVISNAMAARSTTVLPLGTLTVNFAGAFFIGVLIVLVSERFEVAAHWRVFLISGLLGSLTTFSTFSLELVEMIHAGHWVPAVTYILLSVVFCIFLVMAGMYVARIV